MWADASTTAPATVMRVVSRRACGRWALVACGIALLCALPALVGGWPAADSALTAAQLRARIIGSADVPYQGYAESTAALGLPSLPDVGDVASLLDGTTDQYVWYRSASQWRADMLSAAGETDTYEAGALGTFRWSYSANLLTQIVGSQPVRVPRAADLLPPALAQRVVSYAGPGTRVSRLPARRIAGVDVAGLRLSPDGAAARQSVISSIDIWADPRTGLAVQVEIFGRGAAGPVLVSKFLDVSLSAPAAGVLRPKFGAEVDHTTSSLPNVSRLLYGLGPALPARLGGMARVSGVPGLPELAAYGSGLARFVVIPLPGRTGRELLNAAITAGGIIQLGNATAVAIQTPLLTVLVVQRPASPVYLLTGTVTTAVLERAAQQLPGYS
ncbi:MAG: hypothetical protein J2P27_01005 [Actinobacteria bacterium]|nr:hypothetical protein [Actinomycetota bacterium]